jgi:heme exporter protein D
MAEFFAMGGYGAYIWPAYGVSAVGIVLLYYVRRNKLQRAIQAEKKNLNT